MSDLTVDRTVELGCEVIKHFVGFVKGMMDKSWLSVNFSP